MNCLVFTSAIKASEYFEDLFKRLGWRYSAPDEDSFFPSKEWLYERFLEMRAGIKTKEMGVCRGDAYICVVKIGRNRFVYGLNPESEIKYKECLA